MRLQIFRRWLVAALLIVVVAGGVARADEGGEAKTYGEGVDGLKGLWSDVLAKAQSGDEAAVRGLLEKMVMSEEDFAAVFPEDKAKEVAGRYAEKFVKAWPNEAKNLVTKVKERNYDDVEVIEHVASKDGSGGDKSDKKVLSALKEGTKMYIVRVKKKGDKTGLRYDSFFFVNGNWKTGLKLLKLLQPDEKKKGDKPAKGGEKPPAGEEKKDGEKPPEEKKEGEGGGE